MTATTDPRTEAYDAVRSALHGLMAAERRLRARDQRLEGEITTNHVRAMFILAKQDELPAGKLAEAADMTPASVTQMLDHLEARGLVARGRSATDRRVVTVNLTGAGREKVAAKRAAWDARWESALAEFDAGELRAAAAVLTRARELMDSIAAKGAVRR